MLRRAAVTAALALAASAPAPAGAAWLVVHTWPWTGCAGAAAAVLASGGRALDAVVAGASAAERDPTVESVGRGAHPDASGEPTLDALVMDGDSSRVGAVGALRSVASAAAAARLVLDHSRHSLLVGSQASDFAASFGGMPLEPLTSDASDAAFARWQAAGCQARPCLCKPLGRAAAARALLRG
jgi:N4-(beta-N-acetylglucosaminyl)-L-asparaginase